MPDVATQPGLEDAHRPGHLAGVCQVVARLFDLIMPAIAVFGEKDYQQLLTIAAMVEASRRRWDDLQIIGNPTVREPDGLALSTRNEYLNTEQREQALGLSRSLKEACTASDPHGAEESMQRALGDHKLDVQYAVIRDAQTLMPIETFDRPARALIAASLGDVRLIDNASIE